MEANWLVLQAEGSCENGPIWIAATPFKELDDAKAFLRHVISDEWGHLVLETPDGDVIEQRLGDVPGYKEPRSSSVKHAHVYYDEDGMEAWDMLGLEKQIKIVRICKEGERTC